MVEKMSSAVRSTISSIVGLVVFALLLFIPAGTRDYWQAWVFLGVVIVVSSLPSLYLNRIDPAAIERRRRAGPKAETRPIQKTVVTAIMVCFAATMVVAGLDHRYGWSNVPAVLSIVGNVLVAAGLGAALLVVFQNRYAAATITVEENQPLVSTGLYGIVRHPMYSASLVMMIGMPLALGSYWALPVALIGVVPLIVRILDEEKLLRQQLAGYDDYTRQVCYRLIPLAW
jgi:protein-S-isoprenylcysteine O-methyltransferase Ste14